MTPISTIAIATPTVQIPKSHNWYCCFSCKCFRRVSQSPTPTPEVNKVTDVYQYSIQKIECPRGPKINPIRVSMDISELPTRDRLEIYFEPRESSDIDIWFYPEFTE